VSERQATAQTPYGEVKFPVLLCDRQGCKSITVPQEAMGWWTVDPINRMDVLDQPDIEKLSHFCSTRCLRIVVSGEDPSVTP